MQYSRWKCVYACSWLIAAVLGLHDCAPKPPGTVPKIDSVKIRFEQIGRNDSKNLDEWPVIAEVLKRFGCNDCDTVEGRLRQTLGTISTYDYDVTLNWRPPRPVGEFSRLHAQLIGLNIRHIDIALARADVTATYFGLAGEGKITIIVTIEITPLSHLYLDVRQTGVFVEVETHDNVYRQEIKIRKGQEWIFYYTKMTIGQETKRKFFRLNIWTQQQEELSEDEFNLAVKGKPKE